MDLGTIFIATTVGWFFGYRRGKRVKKPRVCEHGVRIDALKCLRCAAARVSK